MNRRRSDSGVETLEVLILVPVLLLAVFGSIQMGMWWFARNAALAAAQQGARVGAAQDATTGDAVAAATGFAAQTTSGLLISPAVKADRTATQISVTVTGKMPSLVPGWTPTVTQTAFLPVERITR